MCAAVGEFGGLFRDVPAGRDRSKAAIEAAKVRNTAVSAGQSAHFDSAGEAFSGPMASLPAQRGCCIGTAREPDRGG